MPEMFATPLRSAALGVLLVAGLVLVAALSDRVMRLIDRRADRAGRDARRERFRGHALVLVGLALCLVLLSEILQ